MNDAPKAFPRPLELLMYSMAPITTLITAPILAHGLGPVGRGQYGIALAVAAFTIALGNWGQGELFLARTRRGEQYLPHHLVISAVAGALAGLATLGLLVAVGLPLTVAAATAVWVPLLSQVNLSRAASIAHRRLTFPALDSALGPIFRVGVLAILLALSLLTVETALTGAQGALALGALLTVGLALRRWKSPPENSSVSQKRRLLRDGSSIVSFNVLHAIALRADLVVLQIVATAFQVGIYAAPASLTTASLAISAAYSPRVQTAAFAPSPFRKIAREGVQMSALAAAAAIALWFAGPPLIPLLFGEEFLASGPIIRTLAVAIVPFLMMDIVFSALVVLGRRRELILAAGISAISIVSALLIFCPIWQAQGAAFAAIAGYTVAAVAGWIILYRSTRPRHEQRRAEPGDA